MSSLKIGVIGLPGKWSTEVLADEVEAKTGFRLVIDMEEVWLNLENNQLYCKDFNLCQLDALVVKKISAEYSASTLDRLELLRIAETAGVKVYSGAVNILRLIDRLSCTVTLRQHDIPMPPTRITESLEVAISTVQEYEEAVFKPLYSTKARGMFVVKAGDSIEEQSAKIETFRQSNPVMYIQKKLSLPGQDLGMVFLGGQYLGTYARVNQTSAWNTTINSGGKYQNYHPSQEIIDLAYRAQAPFDMDFTTVDVAESEIGPIVFEVSAFGGFKGAKEGIGINAAEKYVDYILRKHA